MTEPAKSLRQILKLKREKAELRLHAAERETRRLQTELDAINRDLKHLNAADIDVLRFSHSQGYVVSAMARASKLKEALAHQELQLEDARDEMRRALFSAEYFAIPD